MKMTAEDVAMMTINVAAVVVVLIVIVTVVHRDVIMTPVHLGVTMTPVHPGVTMIPVHPDVIKTRVVLANIIITINPSEVKTKINFHFFRL
jgi:hypothetical protein